MIDATFHEVLRDLIKRNPEVEAAAIVNSQGICNASYLKPGIDEEGVAAMSAAILALGENVLQEMRGGKLSEVYIKGSDRMVLIVSAGDEYLLFLVIPVFAKLGLILMEAKRASKRIQEAEQQAAAAESISKIFEEFGEDEITKFLEEFSLPGEEGSEL
ncbi:MAG: hypothetical protein DRQ10_03175 [Candidatus Hydrothermota bacterium]|nr:MAG: hypothetical protein DRQ10_03175 [Candidatus Hydrothermae bacterium]